jgi:hypothetical protein
MPADVSSKNLIAYRKNFFNSAKNNLDRRVIVGQQSIANDINGLYKIAAKNIEILENEITVSQAILKRGCGMVGYNHHPMQVPFSDLEQHLATFPSRVSNSNVIFAHANQLFLVDFTKKCVYKIPESAARYQELYDKIGWEYQDVDQESLELINTVTSRQYECVSEEVYLRAQSNILYNSILLSHYATHYVDKTKSAKANALIANIVHQNPLNEVKPVFLSFTNLRNFMWYLNGYRLSGVFSKLTTMELMELAKQYAWLDLWNNVYAYGWHIHFDPQVFDHVTKVLNASSVCLYGVTSSIQMLVIAKHLIFGSEVEKSIGIWEQIKHEAWKRQWRLGNDGVWAIINLLTNFREVFGFTADFANQLTAVFVLLDLVWLMRLHYITMYSLYEQQKNYVDLLADNLNDESEREFIRLEQQELQILIDKTNCMFKVFATSAVFYISGFCLALSSPAVPIITSGFFLCTVAMAINLSYESIVEFNFAAKQEALDAGLQMTGKLLENTFIPIFFMTAYSINLPLALGATAAYLWMKLPADKTPKEDPKLNKLQDHNNDATASTYFITTPSVAA